MSRLQPSCSPPQMSAAKEPLVGHPQLLKCLEDIEEERLFNELLANGELAVEKLREVATGWVALQRM